MILKKNKQQKYRPGHCYNRVAEPRIRWRLFLKQELWCLFLGNPEVRRSWRFSVLTLLVGSRAHQLLLSHYITQLHTLFNVWKWGQKHHQTFVFFLVSEKGQLRWLVIGLCYTAGNIVEQKRRSVVALDDKSLGHVMWGSTTPNTSYLPISP